MQNIVIVSSLKSTATANYLIRAFKDLGKSVFVVSDILTSNVNFVQSGSVPISNLLTKFKIKPDLFMFIEGGTMRLFPKELENLSCITAWYGIDTHMNYEKHLRIARLFDITFIAQKQYVSQLVKDGVEQVSWLPLAFDPSLHPTILGERIYDSAYVGSDNVNMHPIRHQILERLASRFPKMWRGMASPKDMGEIYALSKMVFNKSVNNDLNMRYFEAMGAGAVLMTDPILDNGLEELFEEGLHYLCYKDEAHLVELVKNGLDNSKKLDFIGAAARTEVLAKHTYVHRAQQILDISQNRRKLAKPFLVDYIPVYMSLGMSISALEIVEKLMRISNNGRRQVLINKILSFTLRILLIPLRIVSLIFRCAGKN